MATELDHSHDSYEVLSLLKESGLTVPEFVAIQNAGVRIKNIFRYTSKDEGSAKFLRERIADVAFDCNSFQQIPVTEAKVMAVINALEMIVLQVDVPEVFEDKVFMSLFQRPLVPEDARIEDVAQRKVQQGKSMGVSINNLRKRMPIRDIHQVEDRNSALSVHESGYDLVEEDDSGVQQIIEAMFQIPDKRARQIIISLAQEEDTSHYSADEISNARNALREILQREDKLLDEEEEGSTRRGRSLDTIRESRKELAMMVEELGLETVIQLAEKSNLPFKYKALIFYYLGYFHSDENYATFEANEGIDIHGNFGKAIRQLQHHMNIKLKSSSVSLKEFSNQLEIESVKRRGDKLRIPSLTGDNLINAILDLIKKDHDRQKRIGSQSYQELLRVLLEAQKENAMPSLQKLSQILNKKITTIRKDLTKIFVRLYPEKWFANTRKIAIDSYIAKIINLEPDEATRALLTSEEKLLGIYNYLKTPYENGRYHTTNELRSTGVDMRVGLIIVGILEKDAARVLKYKGSRLVALKALALRLGATADMFDNNGEGQETWQDFLKTSILDYIKILPPETIEANEALKYLKTNITNIQDLSRLPVNIIDNLIVDLGNIFGKDGLPRVPNDQLIPVLLNLIRIHPERLDRISSDKKKEIIRILLDGQDQNSRSFSENLQHLSENLQINRLSVSGHLLQIFKKLYPNTWLASFNARKLYINSYTEKIVRAQPTSATAAVIASDLWLSRIYTYLRTPDENGYYPTVQNLRSKGIRSNIPVLLTGILDQDITKILQNGSRIIALKVLALRLGATEEMFSSSTANIGSEASANSEAWSYFLKERLLSKVNKHPKDAKEEEKMLENIAGELRCPVDFLRVVISTIIEGNFEGFIQQSITFSQRQRVRRTEL